MMKELHLSIRIARKERIRRRSEDCHTAGNGRIVFYPAGTRADRLVIESGNVGLYHDGRRRAYIGYSGWFC